MPYTLHRLGFPLRHVSICKIMIDSGIQRFWFVATQVGAMISGRSKLFRHAVAYAAYTLYLLGFLNVQYKV